MVTAFSKYFFETVVTEVVFPSSKGYMAANDDQIQIAKILKGDNRSFAVLVDRYKTMVFTLALRMLKNREEAEEISQDTFLKIHRHLGNFKGDSKFSTWIYRITYNSCLDRIKAYKRQYDPVAIDEFTQNRLKTLETAFDDMDRSDRQRAVKECLNKLAADESVLITLFYYEDLSLQEISKIIGIGQNNVKVKLFRARKRLATILRKSMEPAMLENYGQRNR